MSDPPKLEPGTMRLYDHALPVWKSGPHHLAAQQIVKDGASARVTTSALDNEDAGQFHFAVERPTPLGPADILAAYPLPGTEEATLWMLPHIVLRRRTYPWEVQLQGPFTREDPWVFLLLVADK